MKKVLTIVLLAVISFSLFSCGESAREKEERERKERAAKFKSVGGALGALVKMGNGMGKAAKISGEKRKLRRSKGDTLAMNYIDLQKFLPVIDGYTMEDPGGGSVNMTGMSYSNAEGRYKKGKGETIKVSIIDYNQAFALYSAATMVWSMGITIDTEYEKASGFKPEYSSGGWESFKKETKRSQVTLGISDRFFINIEAEKQENTDFVKEIAKSIDLKKLSEF